MYTHFPQMLALKCLQCCALMQVKNQLYFDLALAIYCCNITNKRKSPDTQTSNKLIIDCGRSWIGSEVPGQNKDGKIGICSFSTKYAALRRKNKG